MDPYVHHILSLICEIIEPYLIRDVASIIVEMVPEPVSINGHSGTTSGIRICGKRYGKWTSAYAVHWTETRHFAHNLPHGSHKYYKNDVLYGEDVYVYGSLIMTRDWNINTGSLLACKRYKNNLSHGL
jgi:hypothetical protein